MDFRRPWPFALFVLLAHVLSRILAVAAHEVLGHAAAAYLLGGTAYGLYVSPGTGFTYVYLPRALPPAGVIAMQGAGIAVNVAIGLALWWRTRRSPSFAWRAFGLVAAVARTVFAVILPAPNARAAALATLGAFALLHLLCFVNVRILPGEPYWSIRSLAPTPPRTVVHADPRVASHNRLYPCESRRHLARTWFEDHGWTA